MTEVIQGSGHCLCGRVRFSAQQVNPHVGVCHCGMCRKWSGTPFMSIECGADVQFEGKEQITEYKSSEWATRGFCKQCGTNLFYRLDGQNIYILPAGLFDSDAGFVFDHQIFIDEKPDYYDFANQTENMTGAEVFAKYAG